MNVLEKMCSKIILKVTRNQGFTISLEDTFLKEPQGGVWSIWPNPGKFGLIFRTAC